MEEIKRKNNPDFAYCIENQACYPAVTAFVICRAKGGIFDYDFVRECYRIDSGRYDECGDCYTHCPTRVIKHKRMK